jgi:DNA-binding IclR family transcriptional regulator
LVTRWGGNRRRFITHPAITIGPRQHELDLEPIPPPRDSVLVRVSQIVDAFDPATPILSLGKLTERTGLPKSTVYRLIEQLVDLRWLERTASGYRLGFKFFELGGLVAMRNRLRTCAVPYLQDLRTAAGQSVHMGVLDGLDVLILAKIWGHGASVPTWDGGRMPAYCTATGKVLLAYAGEEVIEAAIERGLRRRTSGTIVNPNVFRQTLATIRANGYATESEENVRGLCCAAAPVLHGEHALAAVSLSGAVHRLDVVKAIPLVKRCAANIWTSLQQPEQVWFSR